MFHDEQLDTAPLTTSTLPTVEAPRWRLLDFVAGVLLLGLGFAVTVAIGIAVSVYGLIQRGTPRTALLFVVVTLFVELWAGVVVLLLARLRHISLRDLGFRAPNSWSFVSIAIFGAYASVIGYGIAVLILERVLGADLSAYRAGNPIPPDLPKTPLVWGVLGLAVVLAAPIGEELFFRGLLYRGLAGMVGPAPAIIVSGFAFAAVHANLSVILPFALIGMTFAWVYRSSGSLWTTIVAHAIFNGVSFAFTLYGVDL